MKVVILGGHGDGLVAAQVLKDMARSGSDISLVGFLNDHHAKGDMIAGYPVLGLTSEWGQLGEDVLFHFSLLSVGKMKQRVELIENFHIPQERLVSLVHPTAQIADDVSIGIGSLIAAYAVFQPGSQLGRCCSVRAGANVGHDVLISDFVYVGPNSTVCGYAKLGKGAFVAPNAVVRDKTTLGDFAVLAAGSVAYKDQPANTTYLGNPSRRLR